MFVKNFHAEFHEIPTERRVADIISRIDGGRTDERTCFPHKGSCFVVRMKCLILIKGHKEITRKTCAVSTDCASSVSFGIARARRTSTVSTSDTKYLSLLLFKGLSWNLLNYLTVNIN